MLDIDALSLPIDDSGSAGPDLGYTDVAALERDAAGAAGNVDPTTNERVGAEEPNWPHVAEAAGRLLRRTKDLRVAACLARAELSNRGLSGLADGLRLIAALLEKTWPTLHPILDATENDNPIDRINVLANLSPAPEAYGSPSADGLLRALRGAVVAESREVGRFTVRDLDCALRRVPPSAGATPPTMALLAAAWRRGDPAANRDRREGIATGLAAIRSIVAIFQERSGERPRLDLLQETFHRVGEFHAMQDAALPAGGDPAGVANEGVNVPSTTKGDETPRPCALVSRADVVRILQEAAAFLRRSEPSSPAPMFVDRAIKLLQMDFAAIVMELMPDSKDRIELLGGIALDERQDD